MNRFFISIGIMLMALMLKSQAQPRIGFVNSSTTLVTFANSGLPVGNTAGLRVALYGAPDGTTNESLFVPVTASNAVFVTSGRFHGGAPVPVLGFNCFDWGMFQCRAFETNYGNTYEAAVAAPPQNGRRAIVGKSNIGRIQVFCAPLSVNNLSVAIRAFTVNVGVGPAWFTVDDLVVSEGSNGVAVANFQVRLEGDTNEMRSVDFGTVDGTALVGSDYVATNGTLVFAPGETLKVVPVNLTPDIPPEDDERFTFQLSNPVNCDILRSAATCVITEVRLLGLRVDRELTFNTISGRRYAVEKSTDAVQWMAVPGAGQVLGTGVPVTVTDFASGCGAQTYYRFRLLD